MSNQGSESESPVIPSPTPKRIRPRTGARLVTGSTGPLCSLRALSSVRSVGPGLQLRGGSETDVNALKKDVFEVMTKSQDWWPMTTATRAVLHPDGMACGRHVPHRRRRGGGGSGMQRLLPQQLAR
jgi:catalase-peroxidase